MKKIYLVYTGIFLAAMLVVIASGVIVLTPKESRATDRPVLPGAGASANPATLPPGGETTKATAPSSGKTAGTCSLVRYNSVPDKNEDGPTAEGFSYENTDVFTPASAKNYSSSFTKKGPMITEEQAKEIARSALPQYSPDSIKMKLLVSSDSSSATRRWSFDLYKDDRQLAYGMLDVYSGELLVYSVTPNPQDASPALTVSMERAQETAEKEIRDRNGALRLKLVDSRVDSGFHGDEYTFVFRRIINDVPCADDGFIIRVNPGTGKVTGYYKTWDTPENATAAQSVPAITRDEAIAHIEREAKACFPESADGFRIVSADLRWLDLYNHDQYLPNPGVIPLAWVVRFDDAMIRDQEFPVPQEGWVDAQNGTLLMMQYVHIQEES